LIGFEFGDAGFCRGREGQEKPKKNSLEQERTNYKYSQPPYDTQPGSNWGQTGGGQALETLHHLCSPYSWPQFTLSTYIFCIPVDEVTSLNSAGRVLIKIDIRLHLGQA